MSPTNCIKCLAHCPRQPRGYNHLEEHLIDRCAAFQGDEQQAVVLLRQILEEIVRFAHGTSLSILLIRQALEAYPEDEESKTYRRDFFETHGHWPRTDESREGAP